MSFRKVRVSRLCLTLQLGALGVGAVGCASDAEEIANSDACAYRMCDPSQAACVQETSKTVACRLGQATLQPEVRFLTRAEALAELDAEDPPNEEERLERERYIDGLSLMYLMPPGYETEQLSADAFDNVAGYYDSETKGIVLITDSSVWAEPQRAYQVLVHELVHAYQDDLHDLRAFREQYATTMTRNLAITAVVEGEASLHDDFAGTEVRGLNLSIAEWGWYFDAWQAEALEKAAQTPTPYLDAGGLFSYAYGIEIAYGAWLDGGNDGLGALFAQPPESVREVRAGYDAWQTIQNTDVELDPVAVPNLPPDFELVGGAHHSAWLVNALLHRQQLGGGNWHPLADEVTADYLTVLHHTLTDTPVAVWRLHNGRPVAERLNMQPDWTTDTPTYRAYVDGQDAILVATSPFGPSAEEVFTAISEWQPAEQAFPFDDPQSNHASHAEHALPCGRGAVTSALGPRRMLQQRH